MENNVLFPRRNASAFMTAEEIKAAHDYCRPYVTFLNAAKTERETVREAVTMAEKEGFVPWKKGMKLKSGDKIYLNRRGKSLILCTIGRKIFDEGISIIAAHIDSPRLDLKMQPLYEDSDLAFLDTHYYGGIKPYQWTGIPLALHGFIVREDGQELSIKIGEETAPKETPDPRFFIADLLPHLSGRQTRKPLKDALPAEHLDIVAGLYSHPEEKAEGHNASNGSIKLNILKLLNEQYGITEKDFVSAELCAVPAFPAVDIGFDRSMVGAYGQDDKACVYPALTAFLSVKEPQYTSCLVLADKEETGSHGISGARSSFFTSLINDLIEAAEIPGAARPSSCSDVFSNSFCISADVNTCFYPLFKEHLDEHGEAKLNHGAALFRYWGEKGKENTNDADARTTAALIRILDKEKILWQTAEGGKVDAGSSGTLSRFFANLNIPSIDIGVPVLSMHSPFEAASKVDIYMAYRAYTAFFKRG